MRICFADDSYHDYLMCATCDHGAWWHFVSYQLTKPLCRRCPRKSKYSNDEIKDGVKLERTGHE
jgi:CxxC motif-containing protein